MRVVICFQVLLYVSLVTRIDSQKGDGHMGENRPYKFGFNIEGYQHRYEEKNEVGIIMGEYGFITGDGVYHLTVYATDENGNFKIVRTKNVFIGLPGEKITTPTPTISSTRPRPVEQIPARNEAKMLGIAGCGGCIVPTTSALDGALQPAVTSNLQTTRRPLGLVEGTSGIGTGSLESLPPGNIGVNGTSVIAGGMPYAQQGVSGVGNIPEKKNEQILVNGLGISNNNPAMIGGNGINNIPGNKPTIQPSKFYSKRPSQSHPASGSNAASGVPKSPNSLLLNTNTISTPGDLRALLYKFNYTLTFHGHQESGNQAGEKNGSYFFNGRDGFGRNVNYIANEFGYQPNVTLHDLSEDEKPKEESEKLLTKLLGSEFRWYYVNEKQDANALANL